MRLPRAIAPPASPVPRRLLVEEVVVVLWLSFLPSAIRSVVSLLRAPVSGVVVAAANQAASFIDQLLPFLFGLAPAALVVHLVRRSGEGPEVIGMDLGRWRRDLLDGALLFVVVGLGGIAIYLGAVELGVNRFVVPAPPGGYWWTPVAVVLHAAEAAITEEVIVLGYFVTRLEQLRTPAWGAILASAGLRASYHLYQGWGGFAGNLLMGLLFAWLFTRTRRTWPFVVAHFLIDAAAATGFLLFREHLPGF
jgi:membrane protease YdiL (CAAX protease family)